MRRVAALYDIHGNLPALQAVLEDVRAADVDAVVIGGDVVPGPMPSECLAALTGLGVPVRAISGNGERGVVTLRADGTVKGMPEQAVEAMRWTSRVLSVPEIERLSGWPATRRLTVDGLGDVLFCHATPESDTDVFTKLTPAERILPVFERAGAPLVVCGHTHMQFDRLVGGTRVVNAGSVGMPFGEPGAYWLLLGPDVELRRTMYDLEAAAERIRASTYPQADQFAEQHVLAPPPEAVMLERFEGRDSPEGAGFSRPDGRADR